MERISNGLGKRQLQALAPLEIEGVHPKIVSERLRHATVGITLDRSSHVTPAIARDAADAVGSLILGP